MERVVILGRGGAGKSSLAGDLGAATDLVVIELDRVFWSASLQPVPIDDWRHRQAEIAAASRWIIDGDLGPYDDPRPRLERADTVIVLDVALWRCVWRVVRRGRERRDFWRWTLGWRRRSRPQMLKAISQHAAGARLIVLGDPHSTRQWLDTVKPAP